MASRMVVVNKVCEFLADKLDNGDFGEDIMEIVMDELTGDEADNVHYVEDFVDEVITRVRQKLNRN